MANSMADIKRDFYNATLGYSATLLAATPTSSLERAYFGGAATLSLNERKRNYYITALGLTVDAARVKSISDLARLFYIQVTGSAANTIVSTSDLELKYFKGPVKKLIKLGQDQPQMFHVGLNPALYDSRPFDGQIMQIPSSDTWWSATAITQAQFASEIAPFPTGLVNMTQNFVRLLNIRNVAIDWFDNVYWATVTSNLSNLCAAIVASGKQFVGFFFDTESYGTVNPWDFGTTSTPWFGTGPLGQTSLQMRDQVVLRGKQIMDAAILAWPTVKIITTTSATVSEDITFLNPNGYSLENNVAWANELNGAFMYGIAKSAFGTSAKYMDGCGSSYSVRTADEALQYRKWAKTGFPDNSVKIIVDTAEKALYKANMSYAPAVYDLDSRSGSYTLRSAADLQQSLTNSRNYSDEYYWLYTEYHEWGASQSGKPAVTQEYLNAVLNAKAAY